MNRTDKLLYQYTEEERLLGRSWYCITDTLNNPEILDDPKWIVTLQNYLKDIEEYFQKKRLV